MHVASARHDRQYVAQKIWKGDRTMKMKVIVGLLNRNRIAVRTML